LPTADAPEGADMVAPPAATSICCAQAKLAEMAMAAQTKNEKSARRSAGFKSKPSTGLVILIRYLQSERWMARDGCSGSGHAHLIANLKSANGNCRLAIIMPGGEK
jgi:hypothetical protein